jgi:hypothetical protein
MEPTEKAMVFSGKVVSVNQAGKAIVVKGKGGEKTFDVSNVTIKSTVKPGQTIHVTYTHKDGKMVASSVSGVKKMSVKHENHMTNKQGA